MTPDHEDWGIRQAPARHARLYVEPAHFRALLAERRDLDGEPLVAEWAERRRPLIARRRAPEEAQGRVGAGLALPPSHGKKRISFALDPAHICALQPPPALAEGRDFAPAHWSATIDAMIELCHTARVGVRVFGALALQTATGLSYLAQSSDLDLLFAVSAESDCAALLAGLARIDACAPMRIDGELLRLKDGWGAHWREASAGGELLVKTMSGVILMKAADFLRPSAPAGLAS